MDSVVSRYALAILASCLLTAAKGTAINWPPGNLELLHSAHFWEVHSRSDLAQVALKKLAAARPDLPQPLVELGELDLRINNFADAALQESELTNRFKGSKEAIDF